MCRVFRFPHPTGQHGIGTVTCHWVDADRPEAFTADPGDRRELVVQLWYPAPPDPAAPRAPYVRDADALAPAMTPLPELTPRRLNDVTTNAIEAAPVADDRPSYPVLLFLEGIRFADRQQNTFQVEDWSPTAMSWRPSTSRTSPRRWCSRMGARPPTTPAGTLRAARSWTTTSRISPGTPCSRWTGSPP